MLKQVYILLGYNYELFLAYFDTNFTSKELI